jgi:hypothetical protein
MLILRLNLCCIGFDWIGAAAQRLRRLHTANSQQGSRLTDLSGRALL